MQRTIWHGLGLTGMKGRKEYGLMVLPCRASGKENIEAYLTAGIGKAQYIPVTVPAHGSGRSRPRRTGGKSVLCMTAIAGR